MATVICELQQRNDTAANFTTSNPTLLAGELGWESDTGYYKWGDGATAWNSLSYDQKFDSITVTTQAAIDLVTVADNIIASSAGHLVIQAATGSEVQVETVSFDAGFITSVVSIDADTILNTIETIITERADHNSTPTAGSGILWVRNDTPNVLVFTDDAGTDTVLGAGGGGGADVSVGDLTGGNWKVVYSSGAGVYQELALGASGTILTSNGAASAPSWDAAAGGGNVSNTGTPVNDQVAVFTNATTVEGTTGLTKTTTAFTAGNYVFNTDQTVGAGQDNYVLTYDNASGEIGLEAAAGGGSGGTLVSKKVSQTQTATTGTTVIPFDATIPQNTEGDEKLTVSITPADSANTLVITCSFFATHSSNSQWMCGALFQDTTANALASCAEFYAVATEGGMQTLIYTMAAGTTSSTTFKLRVGSGSSGTTTFNRSGATLTMGGKLTSIITVEEFT